MNNIFAEGHAIHGKYQDWLWEMGVLWGRWLCLSCHNKWDDTSPDSAGTGCQSTPADVHGGAAPA
jgi:hypothetical protein